MRTIPRPLPLFIMIILTVSLACSVIGGGSAPASEAPGTATAIAAPPTEKPTSIPPTLAPSPTAGPQKFFKEEFDANTNLANWTSFSFGSGDDKNLKIGQKDEGLIFDLGDLDLYVYYIYEPQTYDDVSLTMVAENRGGNNNNVSLVCRMNADDVTWYEYSFESGGVWYLYAYSDGYKILDNGGSNDLHQGLAVNEYSLTCEGNTITMYINGKKLKSFTDTKYAFTDGQVGLNISSLNVLPIIVEVQSFDIAEP